MSQEWLKIADCSEVGEDETLAVDCAGRQVCLYNLGGQIYATDNRCTHGDADLSEGLIVDGGLIECPLHEGAFDIRTGAPVRLPCTDALRCYEVRVDADAVFLRAPKA